MLCTAPAERDTATRAAKPAQLRARLALEFARSELQGRTILAASHQDPPLRVVRAFPMEDGAALVHLHNISGGLLGGDSLELSVRVGAGAETQVTTTGATRLYRPRPDAPAAAQVNEIAVAENALLEYVPDPLIPYAGARFHQRTTIRLQSGAGLFWWEIVAPGREASGEEFVYERMELTTDVTVAGRLVAAERVRIEPGQVSLSNPARLGPHRYFASFFICREGFDARFWTAAEEKLREVAAALDRGAGAVWSVTALVAHGLVVRCIAPGGFGVLAGLRVLWSAAKQMLYGREAIWPRKVN